MRREPKPLMGRKNSGLSENGSDLCSSVERDGATGFRERTAEAAWLALHAEEERDESLFAATLNMFLLHPSLSFVRWFSPCDYTLFYTTTLRENKNVSKRAYSLPYLSLVWAGLNPFGSYVQTKMLSLCRF